MRPRTIIALAFFVIIVISLAVAFRAHAPQQTSGTSVPIATAIFTCNENKQMNASFYDGVSTPGDINHPPVPGGHVELKLSDGRSMTLAQTISADGARYANTDESFVFWNKGNGALVLENNQEKSYIGCVLVSPESNPALSQVYSDNAGNFSLKLPKGYNIDSAYMYQLAPGRTISGTKFTIPESLKAGTNLSSDSYISVESIPQTLNCSATLFLDGTH